MNAWSTLVRVAALPHATDDTEATPLRKSGERASWCERFSYDRRGRIATSAAGFLVGVVPLGIAPGERVPTA